MRNSVVIATRTSPLAMWQAKYIQAQLIRHHPTLTVTLKGVKTEGDRWLDQPLYMLGGKSLFVKELEQMLLAEEADLAVHSLKDLPAELPSGLTLGAVSARAVPWDAWVCPTGHTYKTLPPGKHVGTSSLRRQMQLMHERPDLQYLSLRGNVETRLHKCDAGEFDAIVLAAAGLSRLGQDHRITALFQPEEMLPAVGQGALGVECRVDDKWIQTLIQCVHDAPTAACVAAERAMNTALEGNCHVPVAGYAHIVGEARILTGRVGRCSPFAMIEVQDRQRVEDDPTVLGKNVAAQLIAQGAREYLGTCDGA